MPGAAGLQPGDCGHPGRCRWQAIEGRRIDHGTVALPRLLLYVAAARHYADDRQVERAREGVIAVVMSGHGHDGAFAVAHQHIVGDPERQLGSIGWIDRVTASEYARLAAGAVGAFVLALAGAGFDIGHHCGPAVVRGDLRHQWMLGSEHAVGCSPQRVGSRAEDPQHFIGAIDGERDFGPFRATDPVALHRLDALRPVEPLQIFQQAVGIGRYLQHPLPHQPLFHGIAGLDILAVLHLLVGEHRSLVGAPVHRHFRLVGQSTLEQFEEDPLRPTNILGICCRQLPAPVIGEAEPLHLRAKGLDVALRGDGRMHAGADGVALGRQAVGVPAHRVQDIEAAHALIAGDDVGRRVSLRVTHMQPLPGGIGKHVEDVEFRLREIDLRRKGPVHLPVLLPLRLDKLGVVGHLSLYVTAASARPMWRRRYRQYRPCHVGI